MPSKLHLLWGVSPALLRGARRRVAGLLVDLRALPIDKWSRVGLMPLLLLIGIQMRNSGMRLRQILLNPWGMKIAATRHHSAAGSAAAGLTTVGHAPLLTDWLHELQLRLVFISGILVARQAGAGGLRRPSSTIWGASLTLHLIPVRGVATLLPSVTAGAAALDFTCRRSRNPAASRWCRWPSSRASSPACSAPFWILGFLLLSLEITPGNKKPGSSARLFVY